MGVASSGKGVSVFVPRRCLDCPSGLLFGFLFPAETGNVVACAVLLLPHSASHDDSAYTKETNKVPDKDLTLLGVWINEDGQQRFENLVSVNENIHSQVFFIFDAVALSRSIILSSDETEDVTTRSETVSRLYKLVRSPQITTTAFRDAHSLLPSKNAYSPDPIETTKSTSCSVQKPTNNQWIRPFFWLLTSSALCRQVRLKLACLSFSFGRLNAVTSETSISPRPRGNVFIRPNLAAILALDLLFGVVACHLLWMRKDWICRQRVVELSQGVAFELRRLIIWLQGAPAGLKLNEELSLFMGNFFFYHIHLWLGYLSFLEPVLEFSLQILPWLGCVFGLSSQLALVNDLLSCLGLHIYCFYVYASRVYFFLVHGLASLFRLFRGKKWNPLRRRVDSFQFDFAQLFLGTLTFTVLLFLFPTGFLYYIFFTFLRLATMGIQSLLTLIVNAINSFPVYSLLLRFAGFQQTANKPFFAVLPMESISYKLDSKPGPVFELKLEQANYQEVWEVSRKELQRFCHFGEQTKNTFGWLKTLAKKLANGQLIKSTD